MSQDFPTEPEEIAAELGSEFRRRFDILGLLGRGGMGVVLRARQRALNREVAVKLMLALDDETHARFVREGKLLARLRHPNIVAVLATGEARGRLYLVFELVEGESLKERIDRMGPLPVEEAVDVCRQLADGLAAAHEQDILHRDVKCRNVMMTADGQPKLADFGLAYSDSAGERLTRSGMFMGTPEYTAPEVIRGSQPLAASDLYALGMVLYESLTGSTSFATLPIQDILKAHLERQPPPLRTLRPDVPGWVEAMVNRLLAKDPRARFGSAAEVARLLEEGLKGKVQASKIAGPVKQSSRRQAVTASAAAEGLTIQRRQFSGLEGQETQMAPGTIARDRAVMRRFGPAVLAGLLLILAAYAFMVSRPGKVLVQKVKIEPWHRAVTVSWQTSRSIESWVEYAEEGPTKGPRRVGEGRLSRPSKAHTETLLGLEPGTHHSLHLVCRDGSRSLKYNFITRGDELLSLAAPEGARLEFKTRHPVRGRLAISDRSIPEESGEVTTSHRFPLEPEDLAAGIQKLEYVFETEGGVTMRAPLDPVSGLGKRLSDSVDLRQIDTFLTQVYDDPNQFKPQKLKAWITSLPSFGLLRDFAPLAGLYFGSSRVSSEDAIEVYEKLLQLECLDSLCQEFRFEPPVRVEEMTAHFVYRSHGEPPFEPRFKWSTDFNQKEHMYWVPDGDDPGAIRERYAMKEFTDKALSKHVFHFKIPPGQLPSVRRAAIGINLNPLTRRRYFQVRVNGKMLLHFTSLEAWGLDPEMAANTVWNSFPARFLREGRNKMELALILGPGNRFGPGAQLWSLSVIGK